MPDTRVEIIRRLARKGAGPALERALGKSRPQDVATAIAHLAPAEQRRVLAGIADLDDAATVLSTVDDVDRVRLVAHLDFDRLVSILEHMEVDDEADLIAELPDELRARVLEAISDDDQEHVEDIMGWPPDSAGGIMQPLAFRCSESDSCRDAIAALHEQAEDLEMVFYLYVENDQEQLVGVASLRQLLTHAPSTALKDMMISDVLTVGPMTDQEEVARIVSRYDLLALPVVDEHRRLLGIVTIDDVVDVIQEEAVEDMLLMAGVGDELDPADTSVISAARQRLTWLLITLVGGIGMAELIGVFEGALEKQAVLAGFIPVILGMGGNVGTQAATIAVRNIATGHLGTDGTRGTAKVLFRETRVGLLLGLFFALGLGTYTLLRWTDQPMLGAAIAISITVTVVAAAAIGTMVPITLNRLGADPAVATGPFVTTGIDAVAIVIYFGTCVAMLGL